MTRYCKFCNTEIEWVSPLNGTGYWSHTQGEYRHIAEPATNPFEPKESVETVLIPNQSNLQHLWESGLVWMINASILHPRGYALAAVFDDDDPNTVIALTIVGDGSEPWCFGTTGGEGEGFSGKFKSYESDDSYKRFCAAEQAREAEWSPKLNPPIKKEVLDLRDPEVEKEFLLSLKEHGVGQTDRPIVPGIDYDFKASLDEMQHDVIEKTISNFHRRDHTELCMRFYDPGFPADYKFCYQPNGHEGGCVYSFRRRHPSEGQWVLDAELSESERADALAHFKEGKASRG